MKNQQEENEFLNKFHKQQKMLSMINDGVNIKNL